MSPVIDAEIEEGEFSGTDRDAQVCYSSLLIQNHCRYFTVIHVQAARLLTL